MRAAVQYEPAGKPAMLDFDEPVPLEGEVLIHVRTVALGGHDIVGAYMDELSYPCVVRGEGVGHDDAGRRVYFGERSRLPYGGFAEHTVVPSREVWEVPEDISDRLAITMGIAGTGAYVPLQVAQIEKGDTVLVTGATGAVGQLALQFARHLGAGRVVAAARNAEALTALAERGIADGIVTLGSSDDTQALMAQTDGKGYDVVLDVVFGQHFISAANATRHGGRIVTIGAQAGFRTAISPLDVLYRWHVAWGTGQSPPEDRHATWLQLLELGRQGIDVNYIDFTFDHAPEAYERQRVMPHGKVLVSVR